VNAFLNTQGGTLYFGVKDDGTVMGFPTNRRMRDLIRLKVDSIISSMIPQVDPNLVAVRFVKVQNPPSRFLRSGEDLIILEVFVRKGRAPIYLVNKTIAYYRLSGSTREFDEETIHERQQLGRPMGKFLIIDFFLVVR
jgi:predicted HTH transcriptional regulator